MTAGEGAKAHPCAAPSAGGDAEPFVMIRAGARRRLVDLREIAEFRDLFLFLVWRAVQVRYAQSALGFGWALIQPLISVVMFTLVFGTLVGVESEGAPYAVFAFAALVPWTYFSNAATQATQSLSSNSTMISKIYFPRVFLPLSSVVARLVDFAISLVALLVVLAAYGIVPTAGVVVLPLLIVMLMLTAAGIGLWLTALSVQFRDVNHAAGFAVRLLMYAAPVVYPTTLVPEEWRYAYALNPLVGVIEGFRAALLGTRDMPWDYIGIGLAVSLVLALTGLAHFRSKERLFADVA